ncbi:class I SAM-dependent methyltransferase [Actinoplanes sp. TRM 88003]|uniref:Class I SAM-dependent methyltransferase n=1 Tax=Paractinoplanes aksuensis TaxID=2939490 RepID=A0ABT1DKG4_9ACTN|nr:class I SAM-dependent methyltransferase [Actinoplanes aksuensis]MCO8270531.1 class I SAM-dependent methyltransferase [Actinoplanes aksuensis]
MEWVKEFYSRTGTWWGPAEAKVGDRDHERAAKVRAHVGDGPLRVLELGSGYGTTAAVLAADGHTVTAVELTDRVRFQTPAERLTVVNEDFYTVRLGKEFDVVCYFNGFGVGSDADQRRLLARIAGEWLRPGGTALIDVSNPFVWQSWHGDEEHRRPDPEQGYAYELRERTTFDQVTCTATDTWWPVDQPDEAISQRLRCYSPADLTLLLEGTGLKLAGIDPAELRTEHEYLAVLRPATP